MGEIPQEAIYAIPVVGMFLGDVMKRLGLNDWVVTANSVLGAVVVMSMLGWGWVPLAQGLTLGLAATGAHSLRKQVSNAAVKNGGGT